MVEKEKGAASIEATISLTLFVFVIMAIYMLINFCIVQAKMSYAINTTAKEMSQYSYFYHALGLDSVREKLGDDANQAVDVFNNFNKMIGDSKAVATEITGDSDDYLKSLLKGDIEDEVEIYKQIQLVSQNIGDIVTNPQEFVKSMASLAGGELWDKGTNIIASPLAKGMTRRHFGNNSATANTYLEQLGVVNGYDGLNFNMSTIFEDGSQDVEIVVYYTLDLASGFPFDLSITMQQKAKTRAWLGGDLGAK